MYVYAWRRCIFSMSFGMYVYMSPEHTDLTSTPNRYADIRLRRLNLIDGTRGAAQTHTKKQTTHTHTHTHARARAHTHTQTRIHKHTLARTHTP